MCFAALLLALGLLLLFYALCRNPDFRACKCLCGGGAAPDRSGPRAELGSRKRGPVEAKNKGSASRDALPPSPTSNGEWVVKGIVIQEEEAEGVGASPAEGPQGELGSAAGLLDPPSNSAGDVDL